MNSKRLRIVGVALLTLAMAGTQAVPVHAATIVTVNDCSSEFGSGGTDIGIGDAVHQANTDHNNDTVQFSCSGTIPITRTLFPAVMMTIDGGGHVALDGGGSPNGTELFAILRANGTITLNNLTLQNGFNSQANGGAIWNQTSTVNILNSTITGNSTGTNGTFNYAGGAIMNFNDATLTISNTTFSGNSAGNAAGGAIYTEGTVTVDHSTFSGNSAKDGGAIADDRSTASVITTNSTFSNNSVTSSGCCSDGGAIDNSGTLSLGGVSGDTFSGNSGQFGGAIINRGGATLSATNATFSDNSVSGTPASGGAISNAGTASLAMSTLSGNSALDGGAIDNTGAVSVVDSTLAGNSATDAGGAYSDENYSGSQATVTDSTLANNTAPAGGEIDNGGGQLAIGGSIVSGTGGGNCSRADTVDNGYNLEWSGAGNANSCGFTAGTDITGQDPQLGPLTTLGGATETMALHSNSPALDSNSCSFTDADGVTIGTDQRGNARPDDGETTCDIGAYEANFAETATSIGFSPAAAVYGQPVSFSASVTAGGQPVTGGSVTFTDGTTSVCGGAQAVDQQTGAAGCSASSVAVGNHTITGTYSGTSIYQASAGSNTLTVSQATTSTGVGSSASSSTAGQSVTFTASVSPEYTGTPSGNVDFYDNGSRIGSGTLNGSSTSDQATMSTSALTAGTHTITASYEGDTNFMGSTTSSANSVTQMVGYAVHVVSADSASIVVQVWNASTNVSSSSITVTAECVVPISTTAPTSCGSSPVQTINKPFTFAGATRRAGAQYSYKLSSTGLTRKHTYYLLVQADSDPNWHAVQFTY